MPVSRKRTLTRILDALVDISYDEMSSCEKRILRILKDAGVAWHLNCGDVKRGAKKPKVKRP